MTKWWVEEPRQHVPTLREFAEANGLVMVVRQRPTVVGEPENWYAMFRDVEVTDGRMLSGTYGNGVSPETAIAAYEREIAGKQLVYRAMSQEHRRELRAPHRFSPEAK